MRGLSVFLLLLAVVGFVTSRGESILVTSNGRALTSVSNKIDTKATVRRGVLDGDSGNEERSFNADVFKRFWAKLSNFFAKFFSKLKKKPGEVPVTVPEQKPATHFDSEAVPPKKKARKFGPKVHPLQASDDLPQSKSASEYAGFVTTQLKLPKVVTEVKALYSLLDGARPDTKMLLGSAKTIEDCWRKDHSYNSLAKFVLYYERTADDYKGEDIYGVEKLLQLGFFKEDELIKIINEESKDYTSDVWKAIVERFLAGLLIKWLKEKKPSGEVMVSLKAELESSRYSEKWRLYDAKLYKLTHS